MVSVNHVQDLLDFVPNLRVRFITIPNADDIFVRSHANSATAYPRPFILFFIGRWLEVVELLPKNRKDNVLPQAI